MYLGVARVAACAAVLLAGSALAAHAGPCGAATEKLMTALPAIITPTGMQIRRSKTRNNFV